MGRPKFLPPDTAQPEKWANVSDEEKEAFLKQNKMHVNCYAGAWILERPSGTTTLGPCADRSEALWMAYDAVQTATPGLEQAYTEKQKAIWNRQRTWIAKKF